MQIYPQVVSGLKLFALIGGAVSGIKLTTTFGFQIVEHVYHWVNPQKPVPDKTKAFFKCACLTCIAAGGFFSSISVFQTYLHFCSNSDSFACQSFSKFCIVPPTITVVSTIMTIYKVTTFPR